MRGLLSSESAALAKVQWMDGAATSPSLRSWLMRLLRAQVIYLAIALIIYGIFWAIRPDATHLLITIVYTLCLCNLTTFALAPLSFLYVDREPVYYWLIFLTLLLVATPVIVTMTTAIAFWVVDRPGGPFWNYLVMSWKFSVVATITFGIVFRVHAVAKRGLTRNAGRCNSQAPGTHGRF
jgi:hypothetical protein